MTSGIASSALVAIGATSYDAGRSVAESALADLHVLRLQLQHVDGDVAGGELAGGDGGEQGLAHGLGGGARWLEGLNADVDVDVDDVAAPCQLDAVRGDVGGRCG